VGVPKILNWMNNRIDKDEMSRMWLFSSAVKNFETGKLTQEEFARSVIEEFEFCVDEEQFIEEFKYFPSGFYAGVKELIENLSKRYSIACLSNTNEIHWNRLCKDECIESIMPLCFLSHQIGYMKPD